MVKIKSPLLTNFAVQGNELLNLLSAKVSAAKVTTVNKSFDNKYRAEVAHVTELLRAIESKFKKCESLYYLYFEDIDHGVLNGNISTLPIEIDCKLHDGVATVEHKFRVDDNYAYKDIIDLNFQAFILTVASLYENLVHLAEIFLKKVIVYIKKPLSSPLHDYIEYLQLLISLGYRENDKLNGCISGFKSYFDQYLPQINSLRNSYIHGFSLNLETDKFNYFVTKMDRSTFTSRSPVLQVDIFTKEVLDQTRLFIRNLLVALKESGKHYTKSIPA